MTKNRHNHVCLTVRIQRTEQPRCLGPLERGVRRVSHFEAEPTTGHWKEKIRAAVQKAAAARATRSTAISQRSLLKRRRPSGFASTANSIEGINRIAKQQAANARQTKPCEMRCPGDWFGGREPPTPRMSRKAAFHTRTPRTMYRRRINRRPRNGKFRGFGAGLNTSFCWSDSVIRTP